ncbi:hypothetical protein D3C75_780710 [compost metagenome]
MRLACGNHGFDGCLPAAGPAGHLQFSRLVNNFPRQISGPVHLLFTQASAVQRQLRRPGIGIHAHFNGLAFRPGPIPVGQQMNHRLVLPSCLHIVIAVLGEAAGVHQPEMRIHTGPQIRGRLSPVIESGPHKYACEKTVVHGITPRLLRGTAP